MVGLLRNVFFVEEPVALSKRHFNILAFFFAVGLEEFAFFKAEHVGKNIVWENFNFNIEVAHGGVEVAARKLQVVFDIF